MKDECEREESLVGSAVAPAAAEPSQWTRAQVSVRAEEIANESRPEASRRRDPRISATLPISTAFIDPVRDPASGDCFFHTSEDDRIFSLSRRGAGVRCTRPPEVGTRILVQIEPGDRQRIDLIGRACWTRVEFEPGDHGARAVGLVGVEFIGGSAKTLDRYTAWLESISRSVVTPSASG